MSRVYVRRSWIPRDATVGGVRLNRHAAGGSVRRLCLIVLSHPAEGSAVPRFISGAKGPQRVSDCQFGMSAKPVPSAAIIGAGLVRLAVGS